MTTPRRKRTTRERAAPRPVSDTAVSLWLLAVLLAEVMLTCWWFGQMYST